MNHELIQTENYLLIVDDLEIKVGDLYLNQTGNVIEKLTYRIPSSGHWCKKIIAHLPLKNSPVLEGVDLLPPIEDDVEKLADEIYPETYYSGLYVDGWLKAGFIKGYNKAKEKYKFTEEDLRKAFNAGLMNRYSRTGEAVAEEEFIKSLQQPKIPIGFEREWNTKQIPDFHQDEPKTTTNSQGQTVWVGKYIFND